MFGREVLKDKVTKRILDIYSGSGKKKTKDGGGVRYICPRAFEAR